MLEGGYNIRKPNRGSRLKGILLGTTALPQRTRVESRTHSSNKWQLKLFRHNWAELPNAGSGSSVSLM